MTEAQEKLIRRTYYSPTGLSTPIKIWNDVKTLDKTITLKIVQEWFQKHIPITKATGGTKNSYVAPNAYFEYQADVFYITDKQFLNQEYPFGLSMIDVFSKYAVVIPMKERNAQHIMAAILKGFKDIGKQPEILYTDTEGALMQKDVAPEFERMGVQHIITAGSAHFVERFNRTFKLLLQQRMDELKRRKRIIKKSKPIDPDNIQWSDLVPQILAVYNNKNIHRITGMTPSQAKKPSSEADAKLAMELVARRGRRFPIVKVGDKVKILRKKKAVGDKEWMSNFKPGDRTVESISENFGQKFYSLSDKMEYIRSDIVKVT